MLSQAPCTHPEAEPGSVGSCTVAGQAGERSPWGDFWLENVEKPSLCARRGDKVHLYLLGVPPSTAPFPRELLQQRRRKSWQRKHLGLHEVSLEEIFLGGVAPQVCVREGAGPVSRLHRGHGAWLCDRRQHLAKEKGTKGMGVGLGTGGEGKPPGWGLAHCLPGPS